MKKRNRKHMPKTPFTRKVRMKFLGVLREGWSEEYALRKCNLQRNAYYDYKRETPEWVKQVQEAVAAGVIALEDEATRRGKNGVLEPIASGGRIIGHKRTYSDKLLSEALKAKSKTYAPAQSTGSHFEHSIAGAAERLLSRLRDLVEIEEQADRTLLTELAESTT